MRGWWGTEESCEPLLARGGRREILPHGFPPYQQLQREAQGTQASPIELLQDAAPQENDCRACRSRSTNKGWRESWPSLSASPIVPRRRTFGVCAVVGCIFHTDGPFFDGKMRLQAWLNSGKQSRGRCGPLSRRSRAGPGRHRPGPVPRPASPPRQSARTYRCRRIKPCHKDKVFARRLDGLTRCLLLRSHERIRLRQQCPVRNDCDPSSSLGHHVCDDNMGSRIGAV